VLSGVWVSILVGQVEASCPVMRMRTSCMNAMLWYGVLGRNCDYTPSSLAPLQAWLAVDSHHT